MPLLVIATHDGDGNVKVSRQAEFRPSMDGKETALHEQCNRLARELRGSREELKQCKAALAGHQAAAAAAARQQARELEQERLRAESRATTAPAADPSVVSELAFQVEQLQAQLRSEQQRGGELEVQTNGCERRMLRAIAEAAVAKVEAKAAERKALRLEQQLLRLKVQQQQQEQQTDAAGTAASAEETRLLQAKLNRAERSLVVVEKAALAAKAERDRALSRSTKLATAAWDRLGAAPAAGASGPSRRRTMAPLALTSPAQQKQVAAGAGVEAAGGSRRRLSDGSSLRPRPLPRSPLRSPDKRRTSPAREADGSTPASSLASVLGDSGIKGLVQRRRQAEARADSAEEARAAAEQDAHCAHEAMVALREELADAKGLIRVSARVRPTRERCRLTEQAASGLRANGGGAAGSIRWTSAGNMTVMGESTGAASGVASGAPVEHEFSLNGVLAPSSTQEQAFEAVRPLVEGVLKGRPAAVLAYGQTGSGKTYTMKGPEAAAAAADPARRGVVPRAVEALFEGASRLAESCDLPAHQFQLSIVEVFNGKINDLLVGAEGATGADAKGPRVLWSTGGKSTTATANPRLVGASEVLLRSPLHALELMERAEARRAVGQTKMNSRSSRSHLLTIVEARRPLDLAAVPDQVTQLMLVDLAGSERIGRTGATGQRAAEAQHINSSLTALGAVIRALHEQRQHIPYRDSQLTAVLASSLRPNARGRCMILAHVSPEGNDCLETVSTMQFAQRVASVELGRAAAEASTHALERAKLQREAARLRAQLHAAEQRAASRAAGARTPARTPASSAAAPRSAAARPPVTPIHRPRAVGAAHTAGPAGSKALASRSAQQHSRRTGPSKAPLGTSKSGNRSAVAIDNKRYRERLAAVQSKVSRQMRSSSASSRRSVTSAGSTAQD